MFIQLVKIYYKITIQNYKHFTLFKRKLSNDIILIKKILFHKLRLYTRSKITRTKKYDKMQSLSQFHIIIIIIVLLTMFLNLRYINILFNKHGLGNSIFSMGAAAQGHRTLMQSVPTSMLMKQKKNRCLQTIVKYKYNILFRSTRNLKINIVALS